MGCKGVVAAGHELTALAAESILLEGGNAFDAILAAHFAACVTEPVLASPGGGGFLVACSPQTEPVVYDFFVQTPRKKRPVNQIDFRPITADFGSAQQQFHVGQGTIATPGVVKGMFAIHRDLGSMPLTQIVAPAVRYARDGVTVNATQAYIFGIVQAIYLATPETREVFGSAGGTHQVLREGEVIRQAKLADLFEALAREGEDLFYRGDVGREIVEQCQDNGGHLTREDLEMYAVVKRKPLDITYRGAHVITNPPPSSGGSLIAFALELIKQAGLTEIPFGSRQHLCLLAEVMALTSKARVDALAHSAMRTDGQLLNRRFLDAYAREVVQRAEAIRGTTHVSVIDSQENVASMTVSNGEGCGSMVPNAGFMLNNMLGEEDLNENGFHLWKENERLTSMMAPTVIVTRDADLVATGSGGSNRIRTALLQVILNLIHFDMDVTTAVTSPRIHLEGAKISVEGGFSSLAADSLVARYPQSEVWTELNLFFGGAHTAMAGHGQYSGVGDVRRGGVCRVVNDPR